eukprot:2110699-Rhodomonas_salina.1
MERHIGGAGNVCRRVPPAVPWTGFVLPEHADADIVGGGTASCERLGACKPCNLLEQTTSSGRCAACCG